MKGSLRESRISWGRWAGLLEVGISLDGDDGDISMEESVPENDTTDTSCTKEVVVSSLRSLLLR